MRNSLNITGLEVPLLLNFKESKLAWKRVVRGQPESGVEQEPRISRTSRMESKGRKAAGNFGIPLIMSRNRR
jgi:hypothetical protein